MAAIDPNAAADTTRVASRLDVRAIALGAGSSLGIGYAASYLMVSALTVDGVVQYPRGGLLLRILSPLIGLFADALGGALAGLLARRRGAMHGALASLLATGGGLVIMLVRLAMHGDLSALASIAWIAQYLVMAALGIGVAALAGQIAAGIAARRPQP
jgi:hypothetical protein